jgi:hypothetical protein
MPEPKAKAKRKISISGGLKKLLIVAGLIYVVVNPLGAAMAVHDTFFWVRSCFS